MKNSIYSLKFCNNGKNNLKLFSSFFIKKFTKFSYLFYSSGKFHALPITTVRLGKALTSLNKFTLLKSPHVNKSARVQIAKVQSFFFLNFKLHYFPTDKIFLRNFFTFFEFLLFTSKLLAPSRTLRLKKLMLKIKFN
jgi:hypothetical protein